MTTSARNRYNELTDFQQGAIDGLINAVASSHTPTVDLIHTATDAVHDRTRTAMNKTA